MPDQVRHDNLKFRAGVEREDGEPLPMAARLLSDRDLERIGAAMRQRRLRP